MKKDLHPTEYRPVVFQDLNDKTTYITRSTVKAEESITIEGVEYPLIKVHISSSSHPFYTGQEKLVDIEGRVDRFKARRDAAKKASDARKKSASKKIADEKAKQDVAAEKEKTEDNK